MNILALPAKQGRSVG